MIEETWSVLEAAMFGISKLLPAADTGDGNPGCCRLVT